MEVQRVSVEWSATNGHLYHPQHTQVLGAIMEERAERS